MYVIIVYDVNQKRVGKFCKFLRRYLNWVQNSVFEGEISVSQYELIKHQLSKMVKDGDCIIIYDIGKKWKKREIIGKEKTDVSNII